MMTKRIYFEDDDTFEGSASEASDCSNDALEGNLIISKRLSPIKSSTNPEEYYRTLKGIYQLVKDDAKALYFPCFIDGADVTTFVKRLDRHVRRPRLHFKDAETRAFKKWCVGHKDILERTYVHVSDIVSFEGYSYVTWRLSPTCSCWKWEGET